MPKVPTKRARSTAEMDPVVETVRSMLEQNVQYFLDNIGTYVQKFKDHQDATTAIIEAQPRLRELNEAGGSTTAAVAAVAAAAAAAAAQSSAFAQKDAAAETEKPKIPTIGGKVLITPTEDESIVEVEFPDNTELKKQLKLLKREAYEMSTVLEGIVDWIDLNAPEKEKGQEDVGTEIQDAVTEQVSNLSEAVGTIYELEMKYLGERSELETTLLAMPEVKSIALAMEIHDGDVWDDIERSWKAMMRVCLIAYSVVSKNKDKLKNPVTARSAAASSIYQ